MAEETVQRALVVVAHPDDAEFIAGGTIAKLCAEGWEVHYVVATSGDKGSHDPEATPPQLARLREDEQRAAARLLGVRDCVFLGHPDGFVEDTPELRGEIVRLIRHYKPATVLTWDPYRRPFNHRDHRLIGQAAVDAVFPLSRGHLFYPEHMQEGLEPHGAEELWLAGSDQADHFIDISQHLERKVDALLCHASQMRDRTREELTKMMRERAEEVGKGNGLALAEGFRRVSLRR